MSNYSLQKYKGTATRHTCPNCGDKRSFTCYVDESGMPLHPSVGRCNHESSCGYHYTPWEYNENALRIASAAEVYGVECMIGCMLEAKISVNAAVHLACAKQIITRVDLDGPVLCSEDPILGGAVFNEKDITVSNEPGLGIKGIEPGKIKYLD